MAQYSSTVIWYIIYNLVNIVNNRMHNLNIYIYIITVINNYFVNYGIRFSEDCISRHYMNNNPIRDVVSSNKKFIIIYIYTYNITSYIYIY